MAMVKLLVHLPAPLETTLAAQGIQLGFGASIENSVTNACYQPAKNARVHSGSELYFLPYHVVAANASDPAPMQYLAPYTSHIANSYLSSRARWP